VTSTSQREPEVWRGGAALAGLDRFRREVGCRSVVLVVDVAVAANGYGARVEDALAGVEVLVTVLPAGEPSVASVDAAAEAARALDRPLVVGVGGGSAVDTAKQVAVVLEGATSIEHYVLGRHPMPGRRPIVAIPTTSGTGAEVTRTCVLTDANGRKVWTWDDELRPDLVVLDPEATATMPPAVTAMTGLDAFVHALEAVTGQRRGERPPEPALTALGLVRDHLPEAVADGRDLRARAAMQEAAFLAGTAIDGCGTGMAHSIGHALGSLYQVPHGAAVALGLEAALEWSVEGAAGVFEPVAATLGVPPGEVPDLYRQLWTDCPLAAAVAALPEVAMAPAPIAAAMVAEENLPMYVNGCRAADDGEREELAARTVEVWHCLRTAAPDRSRPLPSRGVRPDRP
jgi:alcohol dehydrogenase class IV